MSNSHYSSTLHLCGTTSPISCTYVCTYIRTYLSSQAITKGFFAEFTDEVKALAEPIVDAAVEIYGRMSKDLLPTPAKSHYIFNLRDLSKCVQGMGIQYIHYSVTECS